jgi:hypothetical protein
VVDACDVNVNVADVEMRPAFALPTAVVSEAQEELIPLNRATE